MNKREHLIAETFGDNQGGHFARLAAARVRRRRVVRRTAGGAALAAVLLAIVSFARHAPEPARAPAVAKTPAYEIISDEELLAELKDQPLLILRDGTAITGVVFLAEQAPAKL